MPARGRRGQIAGPAAAIRRDGPPPPAAPAGCTGGCGADAPMVVWSARPTPALRPCPDAGSPGAGAVRGARASPSVAFP